ncbi:hypothetical protein VTK73DRAFT_5256 [Phialemonium thermophilum]|uniref:Uncharacterized protein n=1 Tax=Phialemonium thermophilum TaxID=223376 RepID=A0ABR3V2E6_9PEZI
MRSTAKTTNDDRYSSTAMPKRKVGFRSAMSAGAARGRAPRHHVCGAGRLCQLGFRHTGTTRGGTRRGRQRAAHAQCREPGGRHPQSSRCCSSGSQTRDCHDLDWSSGAALVTCGKEAEKKRKKRKKIGERPLYATIGGAESVASKKFDKHAVRFESPSAK